MVKWQKLLVEGSERLGSTLLVTSTHRQRLIDAGFVNVTEKRFKWPINDWPKDRKYKNVGKCPLTPIQVALYQKARPGLSSALLTHLVRSGTWCYEVLSEGLQGMSLMLFTNALGWSAEEVEVFLIDVRKDLRNRQLHGYWEL